MTIGKRKWTRYQLVSKIGVGTTTLFVLMSLLDGEGMDVQKWYDDHRTFTSVKKEQERIKLDLKKEAKAEKRRRRTIEKPKRRYGLRELPGQGSLLQH